MSINYREALQLSRIDQRQVLDSDSDTRRALMQRGLLNLRMPSMTHEITDAGQRELHEWRDKNQ